MTYFSYFKSKDLLNINDINFDKETGNYSSSYYFEYLTKWPELFIKAENNNGDIVGYIMGKVLVGFKKNYVGNS